MFLHVQSAIKSGPLNLQHSYKYRPLDEYLIARDRWHRDKEALIERAQLQPFVDPHQVLSELDEALYRQYLITNTNIHEGKNPHILKKVGFSLGCELHNGYALVARRTCAGCDDDRTDTWYDDLADSRICVANAATEIRPATRNKKDWSTEAREEGRRGEVSDDKTKDLTVAEMLRQSWHVIEEERH